MAIENLHIYYGSDNTLAAGRAVEKRGIQLNSPSLTAVIAAIGPFNVHEWRNHVIEEPEKAAIASRDLVKDMSLLVEGAQPGAGARFQDFIINGKIEEKDLTTLQNIEQHRTTEDVRPQYAQMPFMRDLSGYLLYGRPFNELESNQQQTALGFGSVIDLGHFSRIMQKDVMGDNVSKHRIVGQVAKVLERSLNATFLHRNAELWPVPTNAPIEAKVFTAETDKDGQEVSVIAQRKYAPNVSFGLSITNPGNLQSVTVQISQGRGEMEEKTLETSTEILRHLSAQFESLILSYPLEKAALIFDKYVYSLGMEELGIQLTAVQSIKTAEGGSKAKILTVGNGTVALVQEKKPDIDGYQPLLRELKEALAPQGKLTPQRIIEIATKIGVAGAKEDANPAKLKAKIFAHVNTVRAEMLIYSNEPTDNFLGTEIQSAHRVREITVEEGNSLVIVPSIISTFLQALENPQTSFLKSADAIAYLMKLNPGGTAISLSRHMVNKDIQEIKVESWSRETVLPQVTELTEYIGSLARRMKEVFVSMQFAHIHPTIPTFTRMQVEGAQIAAILGEEFRRIGAKVEGRSLVDEYHTADTMTSYSDFETMLREVAGPTFTHLINESSPEMILFGDAIVRVFNMAGQTRIDGDTVVHPMDDGRILEIWDSVKDTQGNITTGRQACVPFNTGMDLALMNPSLANILYRTYLKNRFPESHFAEWTNANPDMSTHELMTQEVMRDTNIARRNERRMKALEQVERGSFDELLNNNDDITEFDLVALYVLYENTRRDLGAGNRIPIVVHVLETNYNAQQSKAAYVWKRFGFPDIPVFRASFDPSSKRIAILKSPPPQQDNLGAFFVQHKDRLEELRKKFGV